MIENLTQEQKDSLQKKILRYQKNPQDFFREVLGLESHWAKQIEIANSVAKHKRTTVRSGHDVGKSFVAADIVLWFLYCFKPAIVITTAPTWRQVEKVLWGEIGSHWHKSKLFLGGRLLETEIKLGPKHYAIGFSSDAPDSFQGFHEKNILVVVDEPSGVDDKVHEQIESIMANENAKLLMIGNPVRNTGYFADSHRSPLFNKVHISCFDSPNVKAGKVLFPGLVTKQWCLERKEEWGEDSPVYQSRVLGNFPSETEDTLIKLAWIEQSYIRHAKFATTKPLGHKTLGLDVARFGSNFTVFTLRQGRRIHKIKFYRGYDLMHTVGVLRELIEEFQPDDVIIDDNGVGGGVTDRMIELGYQNIVPVNAGEQAEDPIKYYNRRSELAWREREAFRKNELDIPNTEKLVFECNNQFYDHTSSYQIRVMSKSMLKKKGMKSPDFFDSLALTFAKEMPDSLSKTTEQYRSEFVDGIHVVDIMKHCEIGVSRFCMLVPNLNGPSFLLWGLADRVGAVYFYKERIIERATSSVIARAIEEAEKDEPREIDIRYTPQLYNNEVDHQARYNMLEQLEDHGFYFEEVEYNEEIASQLMREGLRYNVQEPLNNMNRPYILFHPDCVNTVRAIKYYMNPKLAKNNPLYEAAHKAAGIFVLTEPSWLKAKIYG